jgi:hypothetical protein
MKAAGARLSSSCESDSPGCPSNDQIVIPSEARNLLSLGAAKMPANGVLHEIHSTSMSRHHIKPSKVGIG